MRHIEHYLSLSSPKAVNLGLQSQGAGVRGIGRDTGNKGKLVRGHMTELASLEGDGCLSY